MPRLQFLSSSNYSCLKARVKFPALSSSTMARTRLGFFRSHKRAKSTLRPSVEAHRRTNHSQPAIGITLKLANPVKAFRIFLRQFGQDERADSRQSHLASV